MAKEQVRFAELLTQHLEDTIWRRYSMEHLTPAVMREIRVTIRSTVDNVFERSSHKLSDDARAWLTDQFFKRIKINDNQLMNDMVVIHEYKLTQLTYHDVELLRGLFDATDLAPEINGEYRTRSAS